MSRARPGNDHHPQDAHNPRGYRTRSNNAPVNVPESKHPGILARPRTRLSIDQVNLIRRCAADLGRGRIALLARAFGVSVGQVRTVVRGGR